jgi:hypothetical protein
MEEFPEAVHLRNALCDVAPSERKCKLQNMIKENEISFNDHVQKMKLICTKAVP